MHFWVPGGVLETILRPPGECVDALSQSLVRHPESIHFLYGVVLPGLAGRSRRLIVALSDGYLLPGIGFHGLPCRRGDAADGA